MGGNKDKFVSEGDDRCPICLNKFTKQWTGIPWTCQHVFCMDCILEWSKNSCSCPIDRIQFSNVTLYNEKAVFQKSVPAVPSVIQEEDPLASVYCQICESPDDEETLLVCDGCDLGYHCGCLSPPLDEVPFNEWFCTICQDEQRSASTNSYSPARRALGRTSAVERVRVKVHEHRSRRTCKRQIESQVDEVIRNILGRESCQASNRPSNKSAKTVRRSSTVKRKHSRKQLVKKHFRLERGNHCSRYNDLFVSPCLSMFGGDMDVFLASNSETELDPVYLLAQKHRQLSAAAVRFNLPLPSLLASEAEVYVSERIPLNEISDVLGRILAQQETLSFPCDRVLIHRNGSLVKGNHAIASLPHSYHKSVPSDTSGAAADSSTFQKKSSDGETKSQTSSKRSRSEASYTRGTLGSSGTNYANPGREEESSGLPFFHGSKKQAPGQTKAANDGNSKHAKTVRKIKIKRITNLSLKHSERETKSHETESEVYDPFNPTDEGVTGLGRNESPERKIYDPFQPTGSDEERNDVCAEPFLFFKRSENYVDGENCRKSCALGQQAIHKIVCKNADNISVSTSGMKLDSNSEMASIFSRSKVDMFADPELSASVGISDMEREHKEQALNTEQASEEIEMKADLELTKKCRKAEPDSTPIVPGQNFELFEKLQNVSASSKSTSRTHGSVLFCHDEPSATTSCKTHELNEVLSFSPVHRHKDLAEATEKKHCIVSGRSKKCSGCVETCEEWERALFLQQKNEKVDGESISLSSKQDVRSRYIHSHLSKPYDTVGNKRSKTEHVRASRSVNPQRKHHIYHGRKGKKGDDRSSNSHKHKNHSVPPLEKKRRKNKNSHSRFYESKSTFCRYSDDEQLKQSSKTRYEAPVKKDKNSSSERSFVPVSEGEKLKKQSKKSHNFRSDKAKNAIDFKNLTPKSGEQLSSFEINRKKHVEPKTKARRSKNLKNLRRVDDVQELPNSSKNVTTRGLPKPNATKDSGSDVGDLKHEKHCKNFVERRMKSASKHFSTEDENMETEKRSRRKKRKHRIDNEEPKACAQSSTISGHSLSPGPSHSKSKKKPKKSDENECILSSSQEAKEKMFSSLERLSPVKSSLKDVKKSGCDAYKHIRLEKSKKSKKRKKSKRSLDAFGKNSTDKDFSSLSEEIVQIQSNSNEVIFSGSPNYCLTRDEKQLHEGSLPSIPDVHSPSSIQSLSPDLNQNASFSQEIKETLSYAEEFVEQSSRRWKHRRKFSGQIDVLANVVIAESGKVEPCDKTEPLKTGVFVASPTCKDTSTSPTIRAPTRPLISMDVNKASSLHAISKNVSMSCATEQQQNVFDEAYLADTDHRADTNFGKKQTDDDRDYSRKNISSSGELGSADFCTVPYGHEDNLMTGSHTISTISGRIHSTNPEVYDGSGLFNGRDFEAFVSRFNQTELLNPLIEVPLCEAGVQYAGSNEGALVGPSFGRTPIDECLKNLSEATNVELNEVNKGSEVSTEVFQKEPVKPLDIRRSHDVKLWNESNNGSAVLNPTQILNSIGLNPQQKSAAQNAILSIAELSKHLKLDKLVKTAPEGDGKELSSPTDNIESSAVEMYNRDKQQGKIRFQERVAEVAKIAIKPYYERREISKVEYKEIMKRAVNKICSSESSMEVNSVKTRRLIRRYIEKYQQKNAFKKDRMKNKLSNEVTKRKKEQSPSPPKYQPLSPPVQECASSLKLDEQKFPVVTPNLLKRIPRQVVTLPDLPLPPPPPPPPITRYSR